MGGAILFVGAAPVGAGFANAFFSIESAIALYNFCSTKGDRSFWYHAGRSPFLKWRGRSLFLGDESKDAIEPSNKFNPPAHLFHF